jgi:hypothetical protein
VRRLLQALAGTLRAVQRACPENQVVPDVVVSTASSPAVLVLIPADAPPVFGGAISRQAVA